MENILRPAGRSPKLLVALTATCLALFFVASPCRGWPVDSYREIRFEHVKRQNTLASCGPAALATLLAKFYGRDINEQEVLSRLKTYLQEEMEKLEKGEVPEGGVSMLELKAVSRDLGVPARGYEIPKGKLGSILHKLNTPLLVRLQEEGGHFVLAVAGLGGQIVLADPTWGIRLMGGNQLREKWEGLTLAFSPTEAEIETSAQVVGELVDQIRGRLRTKQVSKHFL